MEHKHSPLPWSAEGYDETGGYDCMTGGIDIRAQGKVLPVLTLDAASYGQGRSWDVQWWDRDTMEANAALIVRAVNAHAALVSACSQAEHLLSGADADENIRRAVWRVLVDALAKARGE